VRRDPVIIGGTGGSGTSITAKTLQRLGLDIGNLKPGHSEWPPTALYVAHNGPRVLRHELTPDLPGALKVLAGARNHLEGVVGVHPAQHHDRPWGWKLPSIYLQIPFLAEVLPEMRFLLVVRDGWDLALSDIQRNVKKYGPLFLGPGEPSPERMYQFWLESNEWAMEQGERFLGLTRFAAVRFEHLVFHPRETLIKLAAFCGLTPSQDDMDEAVAMVRPPAPAPNLPKQAGPKIGRSRRLGEEEKEALEKAIGLSQQS